MHETRIIMGMPICLAVRDACAHHLDAVFAEFSAIEAQFSPFRDDSEVSRFNRGEIASEALTPHMREVLDLCEQTKRQTFGYFNITRPGGALDPCGIVKGWAIARAAALLLQMRFENFCIEAGGDIQCHGVNDEGGEWTVGIRNPFAADEIVKVLTPKGAGVATSGNYIRGAHIYNPHTGQYGSDDIVSLTVIGPDVLEADRYATAAFAMGRQGVGFIERTPGLEAYEINASGIARMTSGLSRYLPC